MRLAVLALVLGMAFAGRSSAQAQFPVANAGADIAIACVGQNGTPIALNGLGSSIGDGLSYRWTAPGVTFNDPTSLTPIGLFPVGNTVATLTVTFTTNPPTDPPAIAVDSVFVSVDDLTPPIVYAVPDPATLWPPNHKLHDVHVDLLVFDSCDATPDLELVSISSNEDDNGSGDGNTGDDIQGADLGTDDRDFTLRAERSGPGAGRVYTAVYRAWDLADNASDAFVQVLVPHDMGNGGMSDGWHETEHQIEHEKKNARKAEKAQLKAAKKAAKAGKKAQKAAMRAAR
jgi:hypothetical protein